jgi:hypothetical protein
MNVIIKSRSGFRFGTKVGNEWHFDTDQLSESERTTLNLWIKAYPETVVHRPDVIEGPAPDAEFVDEIAQHQNESLRRQIDQSQGLERLNFWAAQHGLRDSERNQRLITEWLDKNVRGYVSAAGVDAAIANLRTVLEWNDLKPIAPPAPAVDEEVLGTLPNGEKQLSTKRNAPHNATPAQCRDWLQRYRAANNLQFNAFGR